VKVKRYVPNHDLFYFIQKRVSPPLVAKVYGDGYSCEHGIFRPRPERGTWLDKFCSCGSDHIADIHGATVDLYYPEYFSDFEQICLDYESFRADLGKEVQINVREKV
jgi:hypothetical protein